MTISINGNGDINGASLGPCFDATRSLTAQTIPDATFTEVVFDTELLDSHNCYSPSTGRFTPTVAGWYRISAWVYCSAVSADLTNCQLTLYKNGAAYRRGTVWLPPPGSGSINTNADAMVFLNGTTDYVSAWVFMDTTASARTVPASSLVSMFNGFFIRP